MLSEKVLFTDVFKECITLYHYITPIFSYISVTGNSSFHEIWEKRILWD